MPAKKLRDSKAGTAANPKLKPQWAVAWWDFTNAHDWLGRRPPKRGKLVRNVTPPTAFRQHFLTGEYAEKHVAKLRRQLGDELVFQIISLAPVPKPPQPTQQLLPGSWPIQLPATKEDP
jgi:hypothetical protein